VSYIASPRVNACEKCEKAERVYQKPRPDCSACLFLPPDLLPANRAAWGIYCKVYDQGVGKSLNFSAVRFVFDLYLGECPVEQQRELFEKLLLIQRTLQVDSQRKTGKNG
jgi:hypothetical protein